MPRIDTTSTAADSPLSARLTLLAGVFLVAGLFVLGWAAPGTYQLYLMVHVLAAVVWVGGGSVIAILALMADRERDARGMAALAGRAELIGKRVFVPASLVVLVFGILMMIEGDLDWGQFWVIAGLVGFAATFLVGLLYLTPGAKRYAELAAEHGVEHPLAVEHLRRVLLVLRFDAAMLLLIVAVMAAKPFS